MKKTVLTICVIMLFCGCDKAEQKIIGTKWKSVVACTPANEFIYIHFIDNATFEYCLVDYDLNKLRDMKESSYIRTSTSDIVFSANDISLQSASYSGSTNHFLFIIPVGITKTLSLTLDNRRDNVACEKVKKKVKSSGSSSSSLGHR
jgi:hypothetical protein